MDDIRAYFRVDEHLATSGQPTAEQFAGIAAAGYSLVINLALPTSSHAVANEQEIVESLGMEYAHIPVSWEEPQLEDLYRFFDVMQAAQAQKVWVHCALNMRVSCFVYLYQSMVLGLPEERAAYPMSEIWQPDGAWEALIHAAKSRLGMQPDSQD
ncbi:protein tyrosine phosphatase family protein [Pseudomaricurvus sp. HS19]|uniref:protein tyrosine phosphatase family protein n=1 Tax=Pseudomaricurvus sp. HS19 TaxID=2692626 RepID=UPI00137091A2|nr:protein tyrosine phosphatase family protein [Pseudomaricurvus sp. HS19]MYM63423.1 phosphatase [Pseudomaricurvus sp. HS19]